MIDRPSKLLIVDDDVILLTALSQRFSDLGYHVRSVRSGSAALSEMEKELPDILLSDLNLPGIPDAQLISTVRRQFPSIRVVAMSGSLSEGNVPVGIAADAFYEKGSSLRLLIQAVDSMTQVERPAIRVATDDLFGFPVFETIPSHRGDELSASSPGHQTHPFPRNGVNGLSILGNERPRQARGESQSSVAIAEAGADPAPFRNPQLADFYQRRYGGEQDAFFASAMVQKAIARWANPGVILVATSLCKDDSFILHAIHQAKQSHAKVLLVHVIPISSLMSEATYGLPVRLPSPLVRSVQAKLEEIAEEFEAAGVDCESIVLKGAPEEEIQLVVKSREVDRVIVSARKASCFARFVSESVLDELIACLDVPVCIIGAGAQPPVALDAPHARVLLATSLRPDRPLLAAVAGALAESNHAQLTLLHVLNHKEPDNVGSDLVRVKIHRRLTALIPGQSSPSVKPDLLVREGDPATVILREAGSSPQDLIILGSPRPASASRLLDTSVVRLVANQSQCPVLIIRPAIASNKAQSNSQSVA
jgi:nucleotide-binding universal stress UspA family protein